ncbi:unnamed protein product [Prorocentrum cordatum]|uniref:RRM domain-containing protein n=1 Tax=Prorocentrum cordatum TaxID=2364126 RepID=A0ABN9X514_9DINO|nr:unnamed protein product [Polarella glacialis]
MQQFGAVDVVFMGNRHDPTAEPPWVRFEKASSAVAACNAINAGQVMFEGQPAKAELKAGNVPPRAPPQSRAQSSPFRSSRDIALEDRRRRR